MVQLLAPNAYKPARILDELTFPGATAVGATGLKVKRVQEWLTLHDCALAIDGEFGPVTQLQLRAFQTRVGVPVTGALDQATWDHLVEPLVKAVAPVAPAATLSATIVLVAAQHVAQHPREAGGDNCGPWVRAYLGWDGKPAKWCAGFTCTAMEQAAALHGVAAPIKSSASCDTLADRADVAGKFVKGAPSANTPPATAIPPGSFFLVRATPTDWTHVGIVTTSGPAAFQTLEGNTNDEGSSDGYEACARARDFKKKDFIVW